MTDHLSEAKHLLMRAQNPTINEPLRQRVIQEAEVSAQLAIADQLHLANLITLRASVIEQATMDLAKVRRLESIDAELATLDKKIARLFDA